MPLKDFLPIARYAGSLAAPITFLIGFVNKEFVHSGDYNWGLWTTCLKNSTGEEQCETISPGNSPAYYEAVRTLACFTLVFHLLYFCTCNEKEGLGMDKKPCVVATLAGLGTTITLAILGSQYRDDSRWKDGNPALGWCYWIWVGNAGVDAFMVGLHFMNDHLNKSSSVTPVTRRPRPRRSSNASVVSVTGNVKFTIFQRGASSGCVSRGQGMTGSQAPRCPANSGSENSGARNNQDQYPVLGLPDSSAMPTVPPPAYEDIVRGSLSPPPPYEP